MFNGDGEATNIGKETVRAVAKTAGKTKVLQEKKHTTMMVEMKKVKKYLSGKG